MNTKFIGLNREGNIHRRLAALGWSSLTAALFLMNVSSLRAQRLPEPFSAKPINLHSGMHTNASPEEILAFTNIVKATNAVRMRLHFGDYNLGEKSSVRIVALADQATQRLDARAMSEWEKTSAIFNGNQVRLELRVAPGEQGVFVTVDQVIADTACCGGRNEGLNALDLLETICGSDDRVASSDNRIGRIGGCTAWLISNGAVLTAGHCAPFSGVFEANVPASMPDGTPVASHPDDQYPIVTNLASWSNSGTGWDWAVFTLRRNANTGRMAHERHGFFRITDRLPSSGSTLRVSGYGTDSMPAGSTGGNNSDNQILQTTTGTYQGQGNTGSAYYLRHRVDTMPGNSGGPIIWESTGFAIGIHTAGGCTAGGGENSGTPFTAANLERQINSYTGTGPVYVDWLTISPTRNGTLFHPFVNVAAAVAAVPVGGTISIVAGEYPKSSGNAPLILSGKSMTLRAPVGPVTIGH